MKSAIPSKYFPSPSSPCPCGSDFSFEKCCYILLTSSIQLEKDAWEAAEQERFGDHLRYIRAQVCRYILWHRAHTAPLMRMGSAGQLLHIDVDALSEIIHRLLTAHHLAGTPTSFRADLGRLVHAIDHPSWRRKATLFNSLSLYLLEDNPESALLELNRCGHWTLSSDPEVLELGIDLDSKADAQTRRQAIERLISMKPEVETEVQYRTILAIDRIIQGETKRGVSEIGEIISDALSRRSDLTPRAKIVLAGSIDLYASSAESSILSDYMKTSRSLLREVRAEEPLTEEGRSRISFLIGRTFEHQGNVLHAEHWYNESLRDFQNFEATHGLIRAQLTQNRLQEAKLNALRAEEQSHTSSNQIDLAFIRAEIALASNDLTLAESSVFQLETLKGPLAPYFQDISDGLLEQLQLLLNGKRQSGQSGFLDKARSLASTVFGLMEIKPAFLGVSFDVKKAIESLTTSRKGPKD